MGLVKEMVAVHGGAVDGLALVRAFREAVVLVVFDGRSALVAGSAGMGWLPVFTSEGELARFAVARGEGDHRCEYRSVFGWRVLDVLLPAAGEELGHPVGVVVDVAGGRPVLLPPVTGVVPESAGRVA